MVYAILSILETLIKLMLFCFFIPLLLCVYPSNTDYLISRAEATLGSIDKVKRGHADYLSNMGGMFSLLLIQHNSADIMAVCIFVNVSYCMLL